MDNINPLGKKLISVDGQLANQPLKLEVNRVGFRSSASVWARHGDNVVLANIMIGDINPDINYLPLSVDYEEKFYAAGKISGSRFIKREGRPSDDAVLTGRLIDRTIRPLLPKDYRNQVQVVVTVLSLDPQVKPLVVSMLAASCGLMLSGAPFDGPINGSQVGLKDNQIKTNLTTAEMEASPLDLIVASNRAGVMMVEAQADQVSEELIIDGLKQAHDVNQAGLDIQQKLIDLVQPTKLDHQLVQPDPDIIKAVNEWLQDYDLTDYLIGSHSHRVSQINKIKQALDDHFQLKDDDYDTRQKDYHKLLDKQLHQTLRQIIINQGQRPDGRKLNQVRPLASQVGLLPRTHGSALFTRGLTQALNIVTLGPPSLAQSLDTMTRNEDKFYFHHYNAPGYTVGEARRLSGPGRREIGHSYLAEKALQPVLPNQEEFPYAIRSVTEIMSQQGSTSMAAACSSCLALMDAGVPIKAIVGGVAMGLIMNDDQPIILTDIQDLEDFAGDMDFKVAGSKQGVTALQMDMKVAGLPVDILAQALQESKAGRATILEHMESILSAPREDISQFAPQVKSIMIPVKKIKDVIGKGGEVIQGLVAQTNCQIDINDDGQVLIFSPNRDDLNQAIERIKELTASPEVGRIYHDRPVVKVADYGMFINIVGDKDGMVHVSEISNQRVNHPSDHFKVGDKVTVKLIAIDDQGRLNLSIKRVKP